MYNLNPLGKRTHNGVTAPRFVFHLAHVAVGIPAGIASLLGAPWWLSALVAVAMAVLDKSVWVDWHGHRIVWTGFDEVKKDARSTVDFVSDMFLTNLPVLIGLALRAPSLTLWVVIAAYFYVGTVFSDPY